MQQENKRLNNDIESLSLACDRNESKIKNLEGEVVELEAKAKSHSLVKEMKLEDKIFGKRLEDYTDEELDKLYAKMKIQKQQVEDYKKKTGSTPQSFNKYNPDWKDGYDGGY